MKYDFNSGSLLDNLLLDYMGQHITLILENGVHLNGKLVDFDHAHVMVMTQAYGNKENNELLCMQALSVISGFLNGYCKVGH